MSSRSGPSREGLTFTIRGANGRPSMSVTEWMFASQVIRSRGGSGVRAGGSVGLGVRAGLLGYRGVCDPGRRDRSDDEPVQRRIGALVDDRVLVEALEVD